MLAAPVCTHGVHHLILKPNGTGKIMHIKEFNIITDFTGTDPMACENGIIAITNNLLCFKCKDTDDFEPLMSSDGEWYCEKCWVNAGFDPLTEGTRVRLKEVAITTETNYIIRNM